MKKKAKKIIKIIKFFPRRCTTFPVFFIRKCTRIFVFANGFFERGREDDFDLKYDEILCVVSSFIINIDWFRSV